MTNSFQAIIERLSHDEASIAMEGEQLEKEYAALGKLVMLNREQLDALRQSMRLMQLANVEEVDDKPAMAKVYNNEVTRTTAQDLILEVMADWNHWPIREVYLEVNRRSLVPYTEGTISGCMSKLKADGEVKHLGKGLYQIAR